MNHLHVDGQIAEKESGAGRSCYITGGGGGGGTRVLRIRKKGGEKAHQKTLWFTFSVEGGAKTNLSNKNQLT